MTACLPLALLLTGCTFPSLFGSKKPVALPPVGVYKSADRGSTWVAKNTVLNTNPPALLSLANTNIATLIFDPTDRATVYVGSEGQGMYFTYTEGESWLASAPIRSETISAIAIPNEITQRCTLYIAATNKIYKSIDCGRHWDEVYRDTRSGLSVQALAVHQTKSTIIFAGLSTGDILRSPDAGVTWQTVARVKDQVLSIIPHALNERILYLALRRQGMQKTSDGGDTWESMSDGLKQFPGGNTISDVAIDPTRPDTVILATSYGLLRSTDGGKTWLAVPLLTPAGKSKISAVAVNPQKPAEIYYTTDTTLYHSVNAGETWETKPLPATGVTTRLIVDPKKDGTLYLGVSRAVGKK